MDTSIEQRTAGLTAWFERRNQRPLLGFSPGTYYFLHRYPGGARSIPSGAVLPSDIEPARFLDDTDELFRRHEEAGGDLIFSAAPFAGVPWVEAALGCGVVADHGAGAMRTVPPSWFATNPRIPRFSTANPWVEKLLEFIPLLTARSAGRYPVGATLMRGVSDLLSALYGGERFVLQLMDNPSAMRGLIDDLTEFWIAMGREVLARLPLFHGGTGVYAYSLWCPGKTIWLQEDAVALLSPGLYEEFIYPADCRIAAAFEHTAIHLHPSRYIPSRLLVESGIDVIELHIDHHGPTAAQLEPHYRTLLERKPLLIWGDLTAADVRFALTELPAAGLAVNVVIDRPERAREIREMAMNL
jgi:hypothetical protein